MKKSYPASNDERERISKIVNEWKAKAIVTETESSYASPVILIKKKSGEDRLVIDFRALSEQTERIHFPLQNIDERQTKIGESKIFIILDLAHGYLQVPMKESARARTAFATPDDTGECVRIMPGLFNAPFYFACVMRKALGRVRRHNIIFYLDDIFISGLNWQDVWEKLRLVLRALLDAKLTVKLSKCQFLKEQVSFLGVRNFTKRRGTWIEEG